MMRHITVGLVAGMLILGPAVAEAARTESEKLGDAVAVLRGFMEIPENAIPPALLSEAYGLAVIPGMLKVGFVVGGRHGSGVLAVRGEDGAWSNPTFITLTGGSIGWQIGASSSDIILVFKSRRSVDRIARGQITLGGDASVAAGPVGRSAAAATDIRFESEVYSYSRSRGLFAGVSLEGAALSIDGNANADFYGEPDISAYEILGRTGERALPAPARRFVETLEKYLPRPG